MILDDIVAKKKLDIREKKAQLSIEDMLDVLKVSFMPIRNMQIALSSHRGGMAIIGELKKASPSKGVLRADFDPIKLAKDYEDGGIAALSILTEKHFFHGRDEYIHMVKKEVDLPILRKDFIIDPWQIYESRLLGADAILLIAKILTDEEITRFQIIAELLGMETIVEIHDMEDLDKALKIEASIIGINNRDLTTFNVDLKNTQRLIGYIPEDRLVVSESGISTREDMEYLKDIGVDAVLIGEAFMTCPDICSKTAVFKG